MPFSQTGKTVAERQVTKAEKRINLMESVTMSHKNRVFNSAEVGKV